MKKPKQVHGSNMHVNVQNMCTLQHLNTCVASVNHCTYIDTSLGAEHFLISSNFSGFTRHESLS